jgi:phosphate-selective porin OprO/OprP
VSPSKPFDLSAGTFGALEVVARYSDLMVDEDAFPAFANPAVAARRAQGVGVGLNWYLNRAFKVALDYERTKFRGGAATGNREPENALLLRFQIAF